MRIVTQNVHQFKNDHAHAIKWTCIKPLLVCVGIPVIQSLNVMQIVLISECLPIFRSSLPDLQKCNTVCLHRLLLDYFVVNMSTLLPQFVTVPTPNYSSTLKNGHVKYRCKQQQKKTRSAEPEKVKKILWDSHSFDKGPLVLDKNDLNFVLLY